MPKISDEQRQARRDQILAAVWRCFLRTGIHQTSMEDIIRESGLSAGAVYLYYKGKDELILAAISTYMGQLRALLMPVLAAEPALPPMDFIRGMTLAIAEHTRRVGIDLNPVIMMGWSEAQTNKALEDLVHVAQTKYREAIADVVRQWQKRRLLPRSTDPNDVAQMLLSLFLGSITQQALLRNTEPEALVRGMAAFIKVGQPPPFRGRPSVVK